MNCYEFNNEKFTEGRLRKYIAQHPEQFIDGAVDKYTTEYFSKDRELEAVKDQKVPEEITKELEHVSDTLTPEEETLLDTVGDAVENEGADRGRKDKGMGAEEKPENRQPRNNEIAEPVAETKADDTGESDQLRQRPVSEGESKPTEDLSYRMQHQIGNPDTTADNILHNVPKDFLENPHYYYDITEQTYKESYRVLRTIQGKPDAEVTIYRAVPKGVKKINAGDWVSLSKTYAKEHGLHAFDPKQDMPVISMKVKASEVGWDSNDINEFSYHPKSETDAIQEQSPSSVLQREQKEIGETGGGRGRVEQEQQGKETAQTSQEKVGAEIEFKFAGNKVKGTITGIDANGNYKVTEKDGTKHLVKPENILSVKEDAPSLPEGTTVIKATDSPHTVEVKIKKKAKEANAKAEEKGITLKEQKADLVGKMELAEEILTGKTREEINKLRDESKSRFAIHESDITPEQVAALEALGLKVVEGQYDFRRQITPKQVLFEIKGDGEVKVAIENLHETLEMTRKEFPEGEYKPKEKKYTGPSNKHIAYEGEAGNGPRESLEIATENLETAKRTGNKKGIEIYQKRYDFSKQQFERYQKEGLENKTWAEIRESGYKPQLSSTSEPVTPSKLQAGITRLKKLFKGVEITNDSKEWREALEEIAKNPDMPVSETASGFVYKGKVYINPDITKVKSDTLAHEGQHIANEIMKKNNPEMWQKGVELALQEEAIGKLREEYKHLKTDEAIADEFISDAVGKRVEELDAQLEKMGLPERVINQIVDWVEQVRDWVKTKLGLETEGTFADFIDSAAKLQIRGKEIGEVTPTDTAQFQKYFAPPKGQVDAAIQPESASLAGFRMIKKVRGLLEGVVDEARITKVQDYFSGMLKELEDKLKYNPDGTLNEKADTQDLSDMARNAGSKEFRGAMEEIANEALRTEGGIKKWDDVLEQAGATKEMSSAERMELVKQALGEAEATELEQNKRFNVMNLSDRARKIYNTLAKWEVAKDWKDQTENAIFTDNGRILANEVEAQQKTTTEVAKFHDKLNKWKEIGPAYKKVIDGIENYTFNVANFPLFAKMLSGKDEGFWKNAARGLQKAVGRRARIIDNADTTLKPLVEKLAKGSTLDGKSIKKVEHVNAQDFFKDKSLPNVDISQSELLDMFMKLQKDDFRKAFFADVNKPSGFKLTEIKGERPATEIRLTHENWETLLKHFEPQQKLIQDTWAKTAEYLGEEIAPVFLADNGYSFSLRKPNEQGWNIYYPTVHSEGKAGVRDYIKRNRFVNDVNSHKANNPEPGTIYPVQDALQVMRGYVENNADYTAYTIPVRNVDVMMKYAQQYMKENDMKPYMEWWNKWKHGLSNREESIGPLESYISRAFTYSALGLNPFVNLKNIASVPLASNVIDTKYLASSLPEIPKALAYLTKNHGILSGNKEITYAPLKEMMQHSDYALLRIKGANSEIQQFMQGGNTIDTTVNVMGKEIPVKLKGSDTLKGLKNSETAMTVSLWEAAKKQVEGEGTSKESPEYWEKVDDLFMDAVNASQSSIDDVHRAFYTKGGFSEGRGPLNRALSLFAGQAFSQFNQFASRTIDLVNNPTEVTRKAFARSFMNLFVLNSMVIASVDSLRDKAFDRDDADYLKNLMKETIGTVPIFAPVLNSILSKTTEGTFKGQDVGLPILDIVDRGTDALANTIRGNEEQALKQATDFAALVSGVPMTPIRATRKLAE